MTTLLNTLTNIAVPPKSRAELERLRLEKKLSDYEYASDLPFQICVYFNSYYCPFWVIAIALCEYNEYAYMNEINRVASLALFLLFIVLEVIRLYLGFYGNLMERVPALAGCLLLTLFIQLPIIIILMVFEEMIISPFERIIHVIEFAFILFELILGYFALRRIVDQQAIKFYNYMNLNDADETDSVANGSPSGGHVRFRPNTGPATGSRYYA